MWATADLYGATGQKDQPPSTAESVTEGGSVRRGATLSWITILLLFFLFRVLYEVAQ